MQVETRNSILTTKQRLYLIYIESSCRSLQTMNIPRRISKVVHVTIGIACL